MTFVINGYQYDICVTYADEYGDDTNIDCTEKVIAEYWPEFLAEHPVDEYNYRYCTEAEFDELVEAVEFCCDQEWQEVDIEYYYDGSYSSTRVPAYYVFADSQGAQAAPARTYTQKGEL